MDMTLEQVRERLAELDPNNRDHLAEIQKLKAQEAELVAKQAQEETAKEQEHEHEKRVNESLTTADQLLEQIELKKYVGEGTEYQLLSIKIKRAFMGQIEELSKRLKEANIGFNDQIRAAADREEQLQRQNELLQEEIKLVQQKEYQLTIELQDMTNRRDAAVAEAEEHKKENEQLKSWNQDLRTQIAVGVTGSMQVVDSEEVKRQEAELEAKLKKERTIYNMEWTHPIKHTHRRAKLAINGEEIEFPYYEESKYVVIPENEVQQFRSQYPSEQPVAEVQEPVEAAVQDSVKEGDFQGRVEPPALPAVYDPAVVPGLQGERTAEPVVQKSVEERLEALEIAVFGWKNPSWPN